MGTNYWHQVSECGQTMHLLDEPAVTIMTRARKSARSGRSPRGLLRMTTVHRELTLDCCRVVLPVRFGNLSQPAGPSKQYPPVLGLGGVLDASSTRLIVGTGLAVRTVKRPRALMGPLTVGPRLPRGRAFTAPMKYLFGVRANRGPWSCDRASRSRCFECCVHDPGHRNFSSLSLSLGGSKQVFNLKSLRSP
jgi:hypothetical protein